MGDLEIATLAERPPWHRSVLHAARTFQLNNDVVDSRKEVLAAGWWRMRDHLGRMVRQCLMSSHARPAPYLAVGQQRQAAQVTSSPRKLKIPNQIVQTKL
jgi:hypothetical protein